MRLLYEWLRETKEFMALGASVGFGKVQLEEAGQNVRELLLHTPYLPLIMKKMQ